MAPSTAQSEEKGLSENEVLISQPNTSSSYEASSTSESDWQEVSEITRGPSKTRRRQQQQQQQQRDQKSAKNTLKLPASTPKTFSITNLREETHAQNLYSDEWIKEDAKRWAATFTGPPASGNTSQEEMAVSLRPRSLRSRPKKRKAEKIATGNFKAKRLRGQYNDDYRQLLNDEIRDALLFTADSYDLLPGSQIGLARWTPAEKLSFFNALARLGKDNVHGIASKIGSKSELEVQEYVQLLHQGMVEKVSNERRQQLLGFTDMPAAIQISQECCNELEKAADALASRQNRYEEQRERDIWGESWLLNSDVNRWIERHLAEGDSCYDIQEVLPAAELLNLRNWLELSTRVFMNPAAPREAENWQVIAEPGEEPAIRATAFTDFHRLAISLTKKLVSTTLFFAMSRLRAMNPSSFNRHGIVKPADVEAAAKIIGLKINSNKFWRECPRRCNLQVVREPLTTADQSFMDYDEVEEILNKDGSSHHSAIHFHGVFGRPTSPLLASPSTNGSSPRSINSVSLSSSERESEDGDVETSAEARDLASEFLQGVDLEHYGPIDPSDSEYTRTRTRGKRMDKRAKDIEVLDEAHASYTEAFDIQASLLEEQRLWGILKQQPPFTIKPEDADLPKRPAQERKEEAELNGWRDHMQFWSQWETLDPPVPAHVRRLERLRASTRRTEEEQSRPKATTTKVNTDDLAEDEDIAADDTDEGYLKSPTVRLEHNSSSLRG